MTQEEKAKAYDKAFERAKDFMNGEVPYALKRGENIMCWIFPELRESEDERIRKELIKLLNDLWEEKQGLMTDRKDYERYTAWLKKKGEKIIPKNVDEAALQYVDTCPVNGEITHDNITEPYWNNHSMINAYKAGWLEKQGSQILANSAKTCKESEKLKFHEGDWIIRIADGFKHNTYLVTEVKDYYVCEDLKGRRGTFTFNDVHKNFKLWNISDAKDGDVLATPNKNIFIFKNIEDTGIYDYCGFYFRVFHPEASCVNGTIWSKLPNDYLPATKEQRDLLFQKMKEAGYEWNADKKELKKIESETEIPYGAKDSELQEVTYYIPKGFHAEIDDDKVVIKKGEKPTTWSEEDKKTLVDCFNVLHRSDYPTDKVIEIVDWLKSLKNRVQSSTKFAGEEQYMKGFRDGIDDVIKNPEDYGLLPTPF